MSRADADEAAFQAWWDDLVRRATAVVKRYDPLAAHAYTQGQIDELKDATAQANARTEQLRAELKRRKKS